MSDSAEARELELVGKVEFRIALADTDTRLSNLLKTYLPPVLLKLTSSSQAVRNKVISICQHVNNRVKSPSIELPVFALAKQFREVDNSLVRHFDLLFIQQGLDRLSYQNKTELFLEVLKSLVILDNYEPAGASAHATIFNLFLRLLPLWKLPKRGTKEDVELRAQLSLSQSTWTAVSQWLTRLLLLEANGRSHGLTKAEEDFLQLNKEPGFWARGSGNDLLQTKVAAANFLASGAFVDNERFIAAVILTADNNSPLASAGDIIFKQHSFDLEDEKLIDDLFGLYFGQRNEPIRLPARPKMQMRILSLLCKSRIATTRTDKILQLPKDELFGSGATRNSGLEASKLRSQIFAFVNWTTRIGDESTLKAIAPQTIQDLRDFIDHQGWPMADTTGSKLTVAEIDLRGHAYESIGILCHHADAFEDLDLVRWLFTSLRCDVSDSQIFVSIEGALGRALNTATKQLNETHMTDLRSLLQWQMQAELGEDDPDYGFETKRSTKFVAVRFANRCLPFEDVNARWIDLMAIGGAQTRQELAEEGKKGLDPYQFALLNPEKKSNIQLPHFDELAVCFFEKNMSKMTGSYRSVLGPAVEFARNVLFAEALSSTIKVQEELSWDRKVDGLANNDEDARSRIKSHVRGIDSTSFVLLLEAALKGVCANQGRCGETLVELLAMSSEDHLEALISESADLFTVALSNDRTNQLHAARALGILYSSTRIPEARLDKLLGELPSYSSDWTAAVGQQVNRVRGSLLSHSYIRTRLMLRGNVKALQDDGVDFLSQLLEVLQSRDLGLRDAADIAFGQFLLCGDSTTTSFARKNTDKLVEGLLVDAKKGHDPAVSALGRLANRLSIVDSDESAWTNLMQKLHDLHEVRQPELHFAVGEAMSVACTGWRSKSLLTELDVDVKDRDLQQSTKSELLSRTFAKTIEDCRNTKPSLRKAAAIWLLCLLQYCGHLEGAREHLRKCQAAFAGLLADRDEIVQESGSRGLGLVYEMGDEGIKRDLVRDLIQSFTGNNAKMGGQVSEDTVLFEEGALPTGDGQSVKTYGEVVKLAQEVGQPNLVYQFMNMAANNAIWTSRAAFGRFGLSNVLADSTLLADNTAFYPKLYRYRFDPNPNVQRSMNDIWSAVVKDTNAVLDEHFDAILSDLLKSIVGREWRVREASCAAIADLITSRDVQKYEGYLNEIWTLAFRVGLDDVKETVRVAGMTLIRTLVSLLIRNLEVGDGTSKKADMMLSHAMPFLLNQLQSGATKEIQEYAVVTMIKIIKKAPSKSIQPFAPQLLETLIASFSSMEPEMINYVHMNAAKYGLTAEKIDRARISGMGTSPIMEAIDRCIDALDDQSMGASMTALESAMKVAIGLPSKVGSSRVVISLCVRHTLTFRPYADRFVQLIKKQVLDRNESVSISWSLSLAYLVRMASDKQIEDIIAFTQRLYFDSEDSSHRAVAGEITQSISRVANDKFMHFATGFLPLAFIARNDSEEHVGSLFDKTWKDNVGGARAVTLYRQEIQSLAAKYIESPKWTVKHASAKAIADLVTNFEGKFEKAPAEDIWYVLEKALAGKTWEGKEDIIKALPTFTEKSRVIWPEKGVEMKKIAIREAKRTNVTYRPTAIKALGDFARTRDDLILLGDVVSIAQTVLEEIIEDSDDKMEVDGEESLTSKIRGETAAAILHAILNNAAEIKPSDKPLTDNLIKAVQQAAAIDAKVTGLTLSEGAKVFFRDVAKRNAGPSSAASTTDFDVLCEKILDVAVIRPFSEPSTEAETLRLKRSEVLLAFTSTTGTTKHAALTPQVRAWRDGERSQQVRQVLDTALGKLSGSN